ncbi:MAG: Cna B-type domain-containing protein [Clostridia bacterium]|nr:Cna B-type domain-containing protein [Clostridia bacterium]
MIILLAALCLPGAVAGAIDVSNETELIAAVETINGSESGEFVINLKANIETNASMDFKSGATKTILGNGHTIKYTGGYTFINLSKGFLYLGDSNDENNTLHIQGRGKTATPGDSESCIQVMPIPGKLDNPVLYMYDGVTISDYYTDNSYGGAVRVFTDDNNQNASATFNMYGGIIQNCGFNSGSNQNGGGVAVCQNGIFNMSGGTITGCSANYGGGVCMTLYSTTKPYLVNMPKFTMTGGKIVGNTAHQGGGICVFNGTFYLEGGTISGNRSGSFGGGVIIYGNYYGHYTYSGAIEIKSGEIINNHSTSFGGGIASIYNGSVTMNGGVLCNNRSTRRGDDLAAIYYGENVQLSSALDMNVEYEMFNAEERTWSPTCFTIDGWYVDGDNNDTATARWNYRQAFENVSGTNTRIGDVVHIPSYEVNNLYIKAAFTGYYEIQIEKTWDDQNNILGKRPDSLMFTLIDRSTNKPVKRGIWNETDGKWEESTEDATITLGKADVDPKNPNIWRKTIAPLLLADYTDSSKYLLQEELYTDHYVRKEGDPKIEFIPYEEGSADTGPGFFRATSTSSVIIPVDIRITWDDRDNVDGLRPKRVMIKMMDLSGNLLKQANGEDAVFTITEEDNWLKRIYMLPFDTTKVRVVEETVEGYSQETEADIVITKDGYRIERKNRHIPEKEEPTPVPVETVPDTGENDHLLMWTIMGCVSGLALIYMGLVNRRKSLRRH